MSDVSYNWIGKDGFEVKSETERFTVVLTSTGRSCSKMRAARAARSFWFF